MRTHYDGLEGYDPEEEEPDTAMQMMGGVISFAIIIGLALAGFLLVEWALGRMGGK